jgi:hypothetical protein
MERRQHLQHPSRCYGNQPDPNESNRFQFWNAQAAQRKQAGPVPGKSLRYCNPLPIPASSKDGSPQGVSLGDVTVVPEGGQYYMFCSGGGRHERITVTEQSAGGWVSKDLVNWDYKGMKIHGGTLPVAPHVVKYKGAFYMSGNNMNSDTSPLFRAPTPLGPYEIVGAGPTRRATT